MVSLLAYLAVVVFLGASALLGRSLRTAGPAVRLVSLAADAFFLLVAVLVFRELVQEPGEPDYALLLIAALGAGAVLHALGVLAWHRDIGFAARTVGTGLVLTALVVPSTLTLSVPLVAFLALTLLVRVEPSSRP